MLLTSEQYVRIKPTTDLKANVFANEEHLKN